MFLKIPNEFWRDYIGRIIWRFHWSLGRHWSTVEVDLYKILRSLTVFRVAYLHIKPKILFTPFPAPAKIWKCFSLWIISTGLQKQRQPSMYSSGPPYNILSRSSRKSGRFQPVLIKIVHAVADCCKYLEFIQFPFAFNTANTINQNSRFCIIRKGTNKLSKQW